MELKDITLELSVQANLDRQDIKVIVNGEDTGVKLKHIFKQVWFETGKITGYSIVEFYSVKDGFLTDKEGNQICFSTERFPEVKINRIKVPLFYTPIEVNKDYIRDVGKLLNLEKTEETIKNLSDADKKALQDERDLLNAELETKKAQEAEAEAARKAEEEERLAEEARKAEEEAITAAEIKKAEQATKEAEEAAAKAEEERIKAEKEAEEAKKAEEEARIQAEKSEAKAKKEQEKAEEEARKRAEEEKQFIVSDKEYDRVSKRSKKLGMQEYAKGGYIFFYGKNLPKGEFPFILKKRENDYLELEGGIVDENDEEVEFEFTDGSDKVLVLDIDTSDITIE